MPVVLSASVTVSLSRSASSQAVSVIVAAVVSSKRKRPPSTLKSALSAHDPMTPMPLVIAR